jgi:hypothetical protein
MLAMVNAEMYQTMVAGWDRGLMLFVLRRAGFACGTLTDDQCREALRQVHDCRVRGVRPSFDLRIV